MITTLDGKWNSSSTLINRIIHITKFGIFKGFKWNEIHDIPDFKQKNLFYGWNYSGKTTLSRIFSSLRDRTVFKPFDSGEFQISTSDGNYTKTNISDFPYEVLVFNSDYVKDNLRWELDEEINAIFFEVGDNAQISQRIAQLQSEVIKIDGNDTIIGEKAAFQSDLEAYEAFDKTLFTIESRRIKNEVFASLIEFDKRHFKNHLEYVIDDLERHILPKKQVLQLSRLVKIDEPKPPISIGTQELSISKFIDQANTLLVSIPNRASVIEVLESKPEAMKWVEKGLELHNVSDKCLFCDNLVTEGRISSLNSYYQNEPSKLRRKVYPLIESVENELESIRSLELPRSEQDLNEGFQNQYLAIRNELDIEISKYQRYLDRIIKRLKEKVENKIFQNSGIIKTYDTSRIRKTLKQLHELIEQNNKFSENFTELIQKKRKNYIRHLVAKYLKDNTYRRKLIKYNKSKKEIDKLNSKIASYLSEIERLESSKTSAEEGGQQFSYFIQSFLGKDDISVKYDKSTEKYNLYRGDQIAEYLSEGEKMAISFSHFLVSLRSLESRNKLKHTIVFIDDPISSLDSNHVFQINALLKDFLYHKITDPQNRNQRLWKQKCKQLFISTHNYEFFNLLKEMPTTKGFRYDRKIDKRDESRYFISRSINESTLIPLPKVYDNFKSEYHFLFKQIHEFASGSSSFNILLMPNVLRRFLEIYTLAKYPSMEEVDDRATEIWNSKVSKRICKPFHFFSHFNNIDRLGQHSELLADVESACLELIEQLKKDQIHYKALMATL